jgi:hypothetical protein
MSLDSSPFKPSSQYLELGYAMKFLCCFAGNVEHLYVTRAVVYLRAGEGLGEREKKNQLKLFILTKLEHSRLNAGFK